MGTRLPPKDTILLFSRHMVNRGGAKQARCEHCDPRISRASQRYPQHPIGASVRIFHGEHSPCVSFSASWKGQQKPGGAGHVNSVYQMEVGSVHGCHCCCLHGQKLCVEPSLNFSGHCWLFDPRHTVQPIQREPSRGSSQGQHNSIHLADESSRMTLCSMRLTAGSVRG